MDMLVLTRKAGEQIVIDGDIRIEVLEVQGNRVRLGIKAPSGVTILRAELLEQAEERATTPRRELQTA
jgi:carbon storage regulator